MATQIVESNTSYCLIQVVLPITSKVYLYIYKMLIPVIIIKIVIRRLDVGKNKVNGNQQMCVRKAVKIRRQNRRHTKVQSCF